MATLIREDSIYANYGTKEHWAINERFDLIIEYGDERSDFCVIDKMRKDSFIELIYQIGHHFNLFEDKEVRFLPLKDKCGISVVNLRYNEMFRLLEEYLLAIS